jgi:ATP-dependent Lon protease
MRISRTARPHSRHANEQLACDLERFTFGWAALPACTDLLPRRATAAINAAFLGKSIAEHRIAAAKASVARRIQKEEERRQKEEAEKAAKKTAETSDQAASPESHPIPDHHLVVARLSEAEMKNPKLKEIIGPLQPVLNVGLPLVPVPRCSRCATRSRSNFRTRLTSSTSRSPISSGAAC